MVVPLLFLDHHHQFTRGCLFFSLIFGLGSSRHGLSASHPILYFFLANLLGHLKRTGGFFGGHQLIFREIQRCPIRRDIRSEMRGKTTGHTIKKMPNISKKKQNILHDPGASPEVFGQPMEVGENFWGISRRKLFVLPPEEGPSHPAA